MNYPIRLDLFNKYKDELSDAWIELDKEGERKFYDKAKKVLISFIDDCNHILKSNELEVECELNYRQTGGYERCVTNYPDKGWHEERQQIGQAYTELVVDFLYYNSNDIEYNELTVKEVKIMIEMAEFLIVKIDETNMLIEK